MPLFRFYIGPQLQKVQVEGPSPEAIIQDLQSQGHQPMGYEVLSPTTTTTTPGTAPTTTTTQPSQPSLGRRALGALVPSAGDVAQLGTQAAMFAGGPFTGGVTAALAPAAGVAARAGLGALREGRSGAMSEGGQGLVNLAIPKVLRPLGAPLARMGGKLMREGEQVGLPMLRSGMGRMAGALERRGVPLGEREARAVTEVLPQFAESEFGKLLQHPTSGARAIRSNLRGLLRAVTPFPGAPTTMRATLRDATLRRIKDETGLDITTLTSRQLVKAIESEPQRVIRALELLGPAAKAGIDGPRETTVRVFWSHLLDRAVRPAPSNLKFPGAFRGGFLDGAAVLDQLRQLQKRIGFEGMRTTFGPEGLRAITGLTQALARASGSRKFLAREGLASTISEPVAAEMRKRGIRMMPILAAGAAALGFGTGSGMMRHVFGGAEFGAGATLSQMLMRGSPPETSRFLAYLLSSPERTQWLTAGIRAMQGGMPDALLIQALSTSLAQLLQREAGPAMGAVGALGRAAAPSPMLPQLSPAMP